jgi:hypothetical protein
VSHGTWPSFILDFDNFCSLLALISLTKSLSILLIFSWNQLRHQGWAWKRLSNSATALSAPSDFFFFRTGA